MSMRSAFAAAPLRRTARARCPRAPRREKGIVQRRSGLAQCARPLGNEVPRGLTSALSDLLVRAVVALGHVGRFQVLRALARPLASRQLTAPTVTGHAALAPGFARFL